MQEGSHVMLPTVDGGEPRVEILRGGGGGCETEVCGKVEESVGFRFLGVHFAPLSVPLERRLQTLAVAFYVWLFLISSLFFTSLAAAVVYHYPTSPAVWTCVAAYAAWMYVDWDVGETGGRCRFLWARNWRVWKYMRDYFPVGAVRTAELDPSRSYIMAVHPHGVLSFATFVTFVTGAMDEYKLFPGIEVKLATLPVQFRFPFSREVASAFGAVSASKRSLHHRLTSRNGGDATVLVVGGAAEALLHHPDKVELVLQRRRGFVKLALEHGKDLVPVFVFGEAFVYKQADNPEGSRLKSFQEWFKNKVSFSPPAFYGRGFFQYTFGFLPMRRPLKVVIGEPIRVEKVDSPGQKEVDELHARYVRALSQLYNKYNPIYGDSNVSLVIS